MKKVGLIMGSSSDLPTVQKAADVLEEFGVPYEMHIYSAHRTPVEAREFCTSARAKGFGVIIAAAGMAAHLDGLDALLSTVQMPSGIPVATVAIDGAKNAAILAVEMLALSDEALTEKLEAFRAKGTEEALAKDRALNAK